MATGANGLTYTTDVLKHEHAPTLNTSLLKCQVLIAQHVQQQIVHLLIRHTPEVLLVPLQLQVLLDQLAGHYPHLM